jgi:hypothetical protein
MPEMSSEPRYPKPKILLVDLPQDAEARLRASGFNVQSGTFGRPYRVQRSDNYVPVIAQAHLPNYTEQEVVIVDLEAAEPLDEPEGIKHNSDGEPDWFTSASQGVVDPRPRVMSWVQDDWKRIFESGGFFVVFAKPRYRPNTVRAATRFGRLERQEEIHADNWSFLPILSRENIKIEGDHGTESQVEITVDFLDSFLRGHQAGLEFDTVLTPMFNMTHEGSRVDFFPLWKNKYGDCIGGIIVANKPETGRILILPQVKDKGRAVYELVATVLPEFSRHLFPYFEGDRWVHADEYEHVSVLKKKAAQRQILEEANSRVAALDEEINADHERLSFLHGILTGTGDELVDDAKAVLEMIGFLRVEKPVEEASTNKQEDLQIHDRSPALLLEVKGLGGQPTEKDTLQGTKYVLRRVKEWNRTDVSGVFLVNHQRNLPALERDHANVFTDQQVGDAVENGMGLMTTWDLFRLARGIIDWDWPVQVVQDVFYGKGRLPSLPSHYEMAGLVAHFYDERSVLSIEVGATGLRVGDTVGVLFPAGFFEEKIGSLQVEKKDVREAQSGQRAGYKTSLKRSQVPEGTPVYVVRQVNL